LQQSQLPQQLWPSAVEEAAAAAPSLFFIGHESPQHSQHVCSAVAAMVSWPPWFFMGHDLLACSPFSLCPPFAFIGHESPSFLQQEAVVDALSFVCVYAKAAIASANTAAMAIIEMIFFFILISPDQSMPLEVNCLAQTQAQFRILEYVIREAARVF